VADNYYAQPQVAAMYQRARPTPHRAVLLRIMESLGNPALHQALDVGCGTGNSSIALADFADSVVAIDSSPEMLQHAQKHQRIQYLLARAEQFPFLHSSFDLVSVGQALHWFNQPQFFAECRRVLRGICAVAIYNDHFTSVLRGMPEFQRWFRRAYSARFRRRRGMRDIDLHACETAGLTLAERTALERSEWLTREQMADFLLTHSNTGSRQQDAREWLDSELQRLIPDEDAHEFVFKSNLYLLRA
jgi:SAM-dependent methyltransferase